MKLLRWILLMWTLTACGGQAGPPPFEWVGGTVNAGANLPTAGDKPWNADDDLRTAVTGTARIFGVDAWGSVAWGSGGFVKLCGQYGAVPRMCVELQP